ncbi:MAG: rhodanese-like domain-containing protein [Beijerinckiaceae bacterium]
MFGNLFGRSDAASPDLTGYDDLQAMLGRKECALVDVREPAEFAGGHAPGAINLPLSQFDPAKLPRGRVVLICKSGRRSGNALALARRAGIENITHFAGGMGRWQSLGGAIVR